MKAQSEAVVLARYTGKTRLKEGQPVTLPATDYTFEILEVFKPEEHLPAPGGLIEVETPGGIVEHPTYTLEAPVHGEERLIPNRKYVLFLNWRSDRAGIVFRRTWGNAGEGVFEVTGERVRPQSATRREHRGMSTATFLAELRQTK